MTRIEWVRWGKQMTEETEMTKERRKNILKNRKLQTRLRKILCLMDV
jgi:hypothetical protein